jgi:hypothetical protein
LPPGAGKAIAPRMSKWVLSGGVVLVASLVCGSALAQATPPKPKSFESSAGLKLLAGGNVWSTPGDVQPPGYDGLGFSDSGGGFGWGGAAYYEARFVGHLGLEVDLGYDSSVLQREVTYNATVKVQEKVTMSGLRTGSWSRGSCRRLRAAVARPGARAGHGQQRQRQERDHAQQAVRLEPGAGGGLISAKSKSSTMLTLAFGMAIHLGENLEIPVDLRAAKNLSQESDWNDRVKVNAATNEYEVTAQSSWDFRLATGLGYRSDLSPAHR